MRGYIENIEDKTLQNDYFREVLFTTDKCQLVVMSLKAGEDIGAEVHDTVDQFIRIESGEGVVILNEEETKISAGSAVIVPAGTKHNVINQSGSSMKLYTIYVPPEHRDGVIHKTKADALGDTSDHY